MRYRTIITFIVSLFCLLGECQNINGIQLPVAVCLQYQRTKAIRNTNVAPFRKYGFRPIPSDDASKRLWGYHVMRDSAYSKRQPPYRMFQRHDIYSFAIIDDTARLGTCQYVFWWKGYYRKFAADLRQMDFKMSEDPRQTNILRFSRPDINIVVEFIIWEDIYVMQIKEK